MTSAATTRSAPQSAPDDSQHLRLRLKPRGPVTGFVDGGWWPRSRDLPAEVPALLDMLADRLGPVERVSYNLDAWGPTPPRKITIDGRLVRLAGYRSQHPAIVDVLSAEHRITLLVVPPEATAQAAHDTLMAAGRRANADPVEALLLASAGDVEEKRGDLDGGAVHMRLNGSRPGRTPDA